MLITGSASYVDIHDPAYRSRLLEVARSFCATGAFPGNGMVYYTPNHCGCFSAVLGYQALSSEDVPAPVADADRLDGSGGMAKPASGTGSAGSAGSAAIPPESPVARDWLLNDQYHDNPTFTTSSGGTDYVAYPQRHAVEARNGTTVLWSFTTGGRIGHAPTVVDGLVYVASHDGWVYCLGASTGEPAWRFLAAPADRKIVAYSQVESAWPVHNVAVQGDHAFFLAGRHPEANGGMYLYQVDRRTGEKKWSTAIRTNREWRSYPLDDPRPTKHWTMVPTNKCVAGPIQVSGGVLTFRGFSLDLGTGAMTLNGQPYTPSGYVPPEAVAAVSAKAPRQMSVVSLGSGAFRLSHAGHASLRLYHVNGALVRTLYQGRVDAGSHVYRPGTGGLPAGLYIVRLDALGQRAALSLLRM
jgi:hypothetical protein